MMQQSRPKPPPQPKGLYPCRTARPAGGDGAIQYIVGMVQYFRCTPGEPSQTQIHATQKSEIHSKGAGIVSVRPPALLNFAAEVVVASIFTGCFFSFLL